MKKNLNSDIESYVKNTNDEIDLRQLYSFVLRNKITAKKSPTIE